MTTLGRCYFGVVFFIAFIAFIATLMLILVMTASQSFASRLSDHLGYGPADRVLILHLDDLGISAGSNLAAKRALDSGLAKSASLIMPAPFAHETARILGGTPDLGIHLTLNGSGSWRPITPIDLVRSLVEADGRIQRSLPHLAIFTSTAEVSIEIESQIREALTTCPSCFTHLDSHMGTVFLRPAWLRSYLKLAHQYNLVPMIPRWSGGLRAMTGSLMGNAIRYFVDPLIAKIEAAGFFPIDDLFILKFDNEPYAVRLARYETIIRNLKPGVTEIIFHPALAETGIAASRVMDSEVLADPIFANALKDAGVKLIGFREIQRRYPWSQLRDL